MHNKVLPNTSSGEPLSARQSPTSPTGYLPLDQSARRVLRTALVVAVFMLVAIASGVALDSAVSSDTTTSVVEQPAASPALVTASTVIQQLAVAQGPSATAAVDIPTIEGVEDPAQLLLAFGKAWRNADWEAMQAIASPGVVTIAQDWHDRGSYPNVTSNDVEPILETCITTVGEGTRCDFTDTPIAGFGFVFGLTYKVGRAGLIVSELTFAGDAG